MLVAACGTDDETEPAPEPEAVTPESTPEEPEPEPQPEEPEPEADTPEPSPEPGPVEPAEFETLVTGLDIPWDLVFLPDGRALVSERNTARVLEVTEDGDVSEVGTVPDVEPGGEGGLHGLEYQDGWLYAYLTASDDNRVVRMELDDGLGEPEVVIDGIPKAGIHNGGRMAFGPDGMLYIAAGDADEPSRAQDVETPAGKILRLEPDGSVPDDNPFDGSPVWSYGHRNVQGLAFDDDERLWASEFGTDIWDELNIIEPGENYGWPEVEGIAEDERFVDPEVQWGNVEASPSGIAYVRDTIFLAALRGQRLWQVPVPDGEAGEPQDFAVGEYGRLRDVTLAPDGTLWILTNNTDGRNPDGPGPDDDRILRVTLE